MLNRLQDVFRSFQQHDVRYLVIGGIASILHGVPRATFDLDILIEATPDNARRLLQALLDAGLGTAALTSAQAVLDNEITIFKGRVAGWSGGRMEGWDPGDVASCGFLPQRRGGAEVVIPALMTLSRS